MTATIQNIGSQEIQTCQVSPPPPQGKLSAFEFINKLAYMTHQAKQEGWCPDFLTNQIFQVVEKNPELAQKFGFPDNHTQIKKQIAEPVLKDTKTSCDTKPLSPEKKGIIEKYQECNEKYRWDIIKNGAKCGLAIGLTMFTFNPGTAVGAISACVKAQYNIAESYACTLF